MTLADETEQQGVVPDRGAFYKPLARHLDEAHLAAGQSFGDLGNEVGVFGSEEEDDDLRTKIVDVMDEECGEGEECDELRMGWELHLVCFG